MKKSFIFLAISALLTSQITFAKSISLYDQPKEGAKVIGTVDSEAGIMPIFTPKDNTAWVKVADPRNGNVGWIKSIELNNKNGSSVTFTQSVIDSGKEPQGFQIQFGMPQKMSPEQTQAMMKQIQASQRALQDDMQRMMKDVFKNTQMTWPNFPLVVPVIMVPAPAAPTNVTTVKPPVSAPAQEMPQKK